MPVGQRFSSWVGGLAVLLFVVGYHIYAQAQQTTTPTPQDVAPQIQQRDYTTSELQLLQELEKRRIALDRREQTLEVRERLVDLAEERLDDKAAQLVSLKGEVESLLKNLSDKEEDELLALAKIYESMKPAAAASVLDRMDNNIVFDLFKRMKTKNTAEIMEKMSTTKARIVSEMLAEKSDLPVFGND